MSRHDQTADDRGDRAPDFPEHFEKGVKGAPPIGPSRRRSPALARLLSSGGREARAEGLSLQRTCSTKPEEVFELFDDAEIRREWLSQVADAMNSDTFHRLADEDWDKEDAERPVRLTFHVEAVGGDDGSQIRVRIDEKGSDACRVGVTHEGLTSRAETVAMNRCWSEALDRLTVRFGDH